MARFFYLALAFLSACTTLIPPPAVAPVTPAVLQAFQITGRISVRHENEGFSGNLSWHHSPTNDEFVILNPLGQGVARITQNAEGVTLETADGKVRRAQDAETLTEQALGFRLPLSGLPNWVQAQAVGNDATLRYNTDGTLDALSEQGWKIEYLSYRAVGTRRLPSKVYMENTELKLRLLIDDWQLPAP
jgi:outer membrane lipoprotein LolB